MAIPEARGPPGYKFLPSSGPISAHLAAVDVTRVSRTTSLASPEASRQHSSSDGHTSAPISLACCPRRSQAGLLSKSNADTSPAEKQSGLSRRSSTMHLQYHHGFVVVGHTLSPFSENNSSCGAANSAFIRQREELLFHCSASQWAPKLRFQASHLRGMCSKVQIFEQPFLPPDTRPYPPSTLISLLLSQP